VAASEEESAEQFQKWRGRGVSKVDADRKAKKLEERGGDERGGRGGKRGGRGQKREVGRGGGGRGGHRPKRGKY
jgi:hypothetical protein